MNIEEAATEILEDFRFEELAMKLYVKMINFWTKEQQTKVITKIAEELYYAGARIGDPQFNIIKK